MQTNTMLDSKKIQLGEGIMNFKDALASTIEKVFFNNAKNNSKQEYRERITSEEI